MGKFGSINDGARLFCDWISFFVCESPAAARQCLYVYIAVRRVWCLSITAKAERQ